MEHTNAKLNEPQSSETSHEKTGNERFDQIQTRSERKIALAILRWIHFFEPSKTEIESAIEKLETLLNQ